MGGSVFGGKTWSLVFEPLRYAHVKGFTFVTFRRTLPEVTNPGGLWDEATEMYPLHNGEMREGKTGVDFPSGARGRFAGLQYESNLIGWKGSQIALINFDQLEEFTEKMFWYMFSRNRSTCGVRPYIRATCNPDPDSWLREFLDWWIDDDGWAIPERSGVIRWMIRVNDAVVWGDSKQELIDKYGHDVGKFARSVTFVLARLQDNKIGTEKDPEYEARVRAMSTVEQTRLLGGDRGGNWNIRDKAGDAFDIGRITMLDADPGDVVDAVRGWDLAATKGGGDWTAGTKIGLRANGRFVILDHYSEQEDSDAVDKAMKAIATMDTHAVSIALEQEPGAGGKRSSLDIIKKLAGFIVVAIPSTTSKLERARPMASQVNGGNFDCVRGPWTKRFLQRLHAFQTPNVPDDDVDSAVIAFNELTRDRGLLIASAGRK